MDVFFDLFQQHNRKLATLVSLALVILLSLSVANGVLFFIENMNVPVSASTVGTSKQITKKTKGIDLASLNLFGIANKVEATTEILNAPETKLNLELHGVFTAEDEANSSAIVAEKNKSGELFHIGDRLPGNAVLAAVFDDHILLRRGSRMEKLIFSDSGLRFNAGASSRSINGSSKTSNNSANRPSQASTRLQRVGERIAQRTRNPGASRQSSKVPGSSLRDYVSANRDRIKENPQELMAQLGMSAVSQGEAKGYKVGSSISSTALMQAGLQQGDVILSVNGKPVGNVMNDSAMIDQAMASKRVRVEVQRDSRRFFLTVPIP